MRLRGSQHVLHFGLKCSKSLGELTTPLVMRGFLPSAIALLRLRRPIPLYPLKIKIPAPLAPQTQNPRTATAPVISRRSNLRPGTHNFRLPDKDDSNFIPRGLVEL